MATRRQILLRGLGGVGAVLAAGLGYRAWDRGVFSAGEGPAFAPWQDWQNRKDDGFDGYVRPAILAANAHNTQPWIFAVSPDGIAIHADRARHLGAFDPFRREMHLSLGCAIENLARASMADGFAAEITAAGGRLSPDPGDTAIEAARIQFSRVKRAVDQLYTAIPKRHTHRGAYLADKAVPAAILSRLANAAEPGTHIVFLTDKPARDELGALIIEATARVIADPEMVAASHHWIRTGARDVERHRDGVTVDASGTPPWLAALAKIAPDLDAAATHGIWLDSTRDVHVATAPVLGVILVPDRLDMAGAIAAGRAWQRLHLSATALGLAAQPLNQPVEMVDRAATAGAADQFGPGLKSLLRETQDEATFVFRLGYAQTPAVPSPRRPLSAVVRT